MWDVTAIHFMAVCHNQCNHETMDHEQYYLILLTVYYLFLYGQDSILGNGKDPVVGANGLAGQAGKLSESGQ